MKTCKKCDTPKESNLFPAKRAVCKDCLKIEKDYKEFVEEETSLFFKETRGRICTACNLPKTDLEFANSSKAVCKLCKSERDKKSNISNVERYLLRMAARRAKKEEVPFELKVEDIIIPNFCPVLGTPIVIGGTTKHHNDSPSLDRLIPKLGYIKSNTRVISFRANMLKNNATIKELQLVLNYMVRENCS